MGCASTKVVADDPQQVVEFFDKYELAEVLGKGAYGTVHRAYSVESNDDFAVKILDLKNGKRRPAKLRKDARSEERAWTLIGVHPNVVDLQEVFVDDSFAYFVMEFCAGSLVAAWEAETDLNEYIYARYFKEMARALAHIHSVGVVHRDVKQDNFIIGAPDGRTVKLCDFGLSAVMAGDGKLSGQVGTPPYVAPEMLTDSGTHGPPVDVWSFGVIVYTAFFGCWPYQPRKYTAEEMTHTIREGRVPPSFAPTRRGLRNVVSGAGIRFVKALLNRNPTTRPTAAMCVSMAYLQDGFGNPWKPNSNMGKAISLLPQLWAAVRCGALNKRSPKVDESQQLHLMKLQSTALLRREPVQSSRDETRRSQTVSADVVGADPLLSQPGLFDIQDHETHNSTEELGHSTLS